MLFAQWLLLLVAVSNILRTVLGWRKMEPHQRIIYAGSNLVLWGLILLAGGFDRIIRWP